MHRHFDRHDLHGAALAVAVLAGEHLALWPYRGRVPHLLNYVLGTAALCVGQSWAEAQRGRSWLRPWGYAAAGGAVVGALHLARYLAWRRRKARIFVEAAGQWPLPD